MGMDGDRVVDAGGSTCLQYGQHFHFGAGCAVEHDILSDAGTNALLPVRHGRMLVNRHDTIVGKSLDYYGEYFEQEVRLFKQMLRPGDVAADVGANIGAHTVPLARMVGPTGRVLAFEPIRLTFQLLCANVALNSLSCVDCVQAALGARDETLMLRDLEMEGADNYGAVALENIPGDIPTPVHRLDTVFRHNRLRLIKIDVEGMEAGVLEGARSVISRFKPALYVENDRVERSRELILLLQDLGYACFWFLPSFHDAANFRGRTEPLYLPGFTDNGEKVFAGGMGINLFCVPKAAGAAISGLKPANDPDEHPLHREHTRRFLS
jgi:FkbM family methyltransferase